MRRPAARQSLLQSPHGPPRETLPGVRETDSGQPAHGGVQRGVFAEGDGIARCQQQRTQSTNPGAHRHRSAAMAIAGGRECGLSSWRVTLFAWSAAVRCQRALTTLPHAARVGRNRWRICKGCARLAMMRRRGRGDSASFRGWIGYWSETVISLTPEERAKFAAWLRQDAEADDAIARQADDIGIKPLAKQKRYIAVAKFLVAKEIESIESFTV